MYNLGKVQNNSLYILFIIYLYLIFNCHCNAYCNIIYLSFLIIDLIFCMYIQNLKLIIKN